MKEVGKISLDKQYSLILYENEKEKRQTIVLFDNIDISERAVSVIATAFNGKFDSWGLNLLADIIEGLK